MRLVFVIVAVLALCQCASSSARGEGRRATIIIGLAAAADQADPRYTMLWRRLDEESGGFTAYGWGGDRLEFTTHSGSTVRAPGLPGEFEVARVDPGVYALDGVFATLNEGGVTYTAQGSIIGPERPAFEARAGEVIFLGIWQASIDGHLAVVRPWRLSQDDLRAVARAAEIEGVIHLRATRVESVPCAPRRIHPARARQVC